MKRRPRVRVSRILAYVALILLVAPFALPALWAVMASLSTNQEITLAPLQPPSALHFENFVRAWTEGNIGQFTINSLIIATVSSVLIATFASGTGYALAWLPFPGKRLVMIVLIAVVVLPVFTYMISLSGVVRGLGLTDTTIAVILATVATFITVPTFMMRSFFATLPGELIEAARIDGAREWRIFVSVMLPLARPGILSALIFAFVWAWNDVLLPIILLQSPDLFTIPYGIASMRPGQFRQDYVMVFAASMISTVPMIAFYLLLQRRFISGLTAGASK